jgi:hypothetical protein
MDRGPTISPGTRISGLLYAFLYYTTRHQLFGVSLAGWLRFLSLALVGWAALRQWLFYQIVAVAILAVLLRFIYWRAQRAGFVRFTPSGLPAPDPRADIADEQKLHLKATGMFSVKDREEYVLLRPADYWRVQNGDHAIMVEQKPGRFLYQFIQPGTLRKIQPGVLCFSRTSRPTLALTFLTSWGPQHATGPVTMYSPGPNGKASMLERTAFLSFDEALDMELVWRNLLRDSRQKVTKKLNK